MERINDGNKLGEKSLYYKGEFYSMREEKNDGNKLGEKRVTISH